MAAREDVSVAELVAAVAETLGETVVATTNSSDRRPEPSPSRERRVAKSATLAQAGLLDGHVLTVVSPDVVTVNDPVFASEEGAQ